MYSAAIGKKQLGEPITFAGIQSVAKKCHLLGHIDLIIVDECHQISHKDEGGYRTLINQLIAKNPALRVIGLTATEYRLGHGLITDKPALFDDLIKGIIQMKWRFLIILVICGAVFCGYKRLTYSPYYVASSTFTINSSITSENSNTYIENATANQMAKSFPYILKSGAFKEVLAQDLGLQSVPGTIEAEVMENTTLFTLKVTAKIKYDNV